MRPALRRVRAFPLLNWVATSCLRGLGLRTPFLVRHLPRVGAVEAGLPNGKRLRFVSRGDDGVASRIFWLGWDGYEPEATRPFFAAARAATVTLDVGAYVGLYALIAAHAHPGARVFAFEPLPHIHDRLLRNVRANGLQNVTCHPWAIGEREETADFFHVSSPFPTSSSLSRPFMERSGLPGLERSPVRVRNVDSFVREEGLPRVDLVKLDTEGTEPEVLRGARETLRRDRPTLFCEVLHGTNTEGELLLALAGLGYRYFLLTPEGPRPRETIQADPTWRNQVFATKGPEEWAT